MLPGRRAHHRRMRLKWDASPWLLVPVPFLAAPAASLWIAAALQAVGAGRPLDLLVAWLITIAGPEPAEGRTACGVPRRIRARRRDGRTGPPTPRGPGCQPSSDRLSSRAGCRSRPCREA